MLKLCSRGTFFSSWKFLLWKFIENLRKCRNIELWKNRKRRATKLTSSPNLKFFEEFYKNLVAAERQKTSILMNRPAYVRLSILELSKVLMNNFHCNLEKEFILEIVKFSAFYMYRFFDILHRDGWFANWYEGHNWKFKFS